jgi:lipoxygenase/linoleate 9S-lipoxygenase
MIFCVDPKYETRKTKKPFYIPRDECFERKKMDDFMADGLRSIVHSASSKISVQVTRKSEFDTVEEIKKLFANKGKKVGGINNVLPHKTDVPTRNQHPLVFLSEVLRPDGQSADPLLYPLPRILQGLFSFSRKHPSIDVCACVLYFWMPIVMEVQFGVGFGRVLMD